MTVIRQPARYTTRMIQENLQKGFWDSMTISHYWDRNAATCPHREALADSKTRLTWAEAKRWIDRLALGLIASGIKRDEVIVIQLPSCVEAFLIRPACEKAGIVYLPANRAFREKEMEAFLKKSEAAGVVIPWCFAGRDHFEMIQNIRSYLPKLRNVYVVGEEVPAGTISINGILAQNWEKKYPPDYLENIRTKATEVCWLAHTTGTTGMPKIVQYLGISRPTQGKGLIERLEITADDVLGVLSPATGGINSPQYFAAPIVAAKVVILEMFEPEEALKLIQKERVTFTGGSPTLWTRVVRHPDFDKYDVSSLRCVTCGGGPLQYWTGVEIEEKLGCPVINYYGSMDCGVTFMCRPGDPQELRLKSVGKPISWGQVKVVNNQGKEVAQGESGELYLTGPAASDGYFQDPETTFTTWTKDEWYQTGDLGQLDNEGRLFLTGRKKDIIIRGGENIIPREIENELVTHPMVAAVAVVGMPDPEMGERACAFVVPKPGLKFTFDEMVSFLRERKLSSYQLPERLEILDKLPLSGEEKVDRKLLVQQITEKLKSEGKI